MIRWSIVLLLVGCGAPATSQQTPPSLLGKAASCLAVKQFFNSSGLSLAYLVDEKSHPGQRVLYVVDYSGTSRSTGFVYSILLEEKSGRSMFSIQNNARFTTGKKGEYLGIDFLEPPLGGTWTQQHLADAIKRVGKEPTSDIRVSQLPTLASDQCQSYTDKR